MQKFERAQFEIKDYVEDKHYGKFEIQPLERGFGTTLGNALRRVLLSSLPGAAVYSIKVEGVYHEFTSIPGVVEDVTTIILNLKDLILSVSDDETYTCRINAKGPKVVTGADIECPANVEVLSKDLVIATLEDNAVLDMEMKVKNGRGYVSADQNKILHQGASQGIGTIFTDSIYTPVKNVKYAIENFRVEQKTDYEKLVFEIITDGSIHPKDALTEAAKTLIHHFMLFSDERITLDSEVKAETEEFDETSLHMRQLLKTKLVDMDLSVRALNCLKAAEVDTLGDLVSFNKNDLMKFRNFGKKSLTELDELVANKNLTFGMDLTKYKLDKE